MSNAEAGARLTGLAGFDTRGHKDSRERADPHQVENFASIDFRKRSRRSGLVWFMS